MNSVHCPASSQPSKATWPSAYTVTAIPSTAPTLMLVTNAPPSPLAGAGAAGAAGAAAPLSPVGAPLAGAGAAAKSSETAGPIVIAMTTASPEGAPITAELSTTNPSRLFSAAISSATVTSTDPDTMTS